MTQALSDSELARAADLLETQAAFRVWSDTSVVRVRGDDRVSWLNGQLTNDVRHIAAHASVHALAVNVRGKILAEVWVRDLGDELLLLVPQRAETALLESLEHFIIMEDVTLERAPELRVLALEGPRARELASLFAAADGGGVFDCDPLGIGGVARVGTAAEIAAAIEQLAGQVQPVVPEAYELVRLRRARPRYGVDFDEHHYPQEAGLKAYVSFQKGCYLGQEVVCTLESRGRLSRHLGAFRSAPGQRLEPGTALSVNSADATTGQNTEQIGSLTSTAWDPQLGATLALGYLRRAYAKPSAQLSAGAQTLTLVALVGEADAV